MPEKTFKAEKYLYIPATGLAHNAQYRLSLGADMWEIDGEHREVQVIKNQLIYNGNTISMFHPKPPVVEMDEHTLKLACDLLYSREYGIVSDSHRDVLVVKEVPGGEELEKITEEAELEIKELTYRLAAHELGEVAPVVTMERLERISDVNDNPDLYGFVFRVEVS